MHRWIVTILLFASFAAPAQKDTALQRRVNEYLELTRRLDFENLMDYIHPKIFTIVPKEQLVEVFKSAFGDEDMSITLDSVKDTKTSATYNYQGSLFRKIDYFMAMRLKFNDSTILKNDTVRTMLNAQMKQGFPGAKIYYDDPGNALIIETNKIMFGIKDPKKKWMFIGYEPGQRAMMEMLVPKPVLTYYKL